ncbi:MAG: hypothetical protein Q8R47_03570 [Nanoarchaeota archaeon]|nr:hypothetical protein [Nanoarchaeota archaeon]
MKKQTQKEKSGISIAVGIMSGIAAGVALFTGVGANPETSIHQIYFVTAQIKYILWSILFMTGALYWRD